MSNAIRVSSRELDRARQVAEQVRDVVAPYLRDVDIEVKDWELSAGASQKGTNINVAVKIELKPKQPPK